MRRPNLRFLLICAAVGALIVFTAHLVHGFQTKRTAKILLVQAQQLRENGRLGDAIGYYQRYIQLSPEDTPALAEYGLALADMPNVKAGAMLVLEQVLRRDPNYPNVRRRLVDVALKTGHQGDAKVHLQNHLLKEHPEDGELWYQLAQCQDAEQAYTASVESYRQAIQCSPNKWEPYLRLAYLLRKHLEEPKEADQTINLMVDKNSDSPKAYFARGQYWLEYGHPEKAMADAEKAVALSEKDVQFLLFAAVVAQELKDLPKAEQYAARASQLDSRDPQVYLVASRLAVLKADGNKAVELLKQGLVARPNHPELLWELANLQVDRGEFDAAHNTIKSLYRASNDHTRPDYLEGRILLKQGDVLSAVVRFEKLRSELVDRPELQKLNDFSIGNCYDRIGYLDQRIAAYRRAVDDDPQWALARMGLAAALAASGRIDEAIEHYQHVLASPNGSQAALQELARLLIVQQLRLPPEKRSWRHAEDALNAADRLVPNGSSLAILRAEMLVAQNETDKAAELLAKASESQPDAPMLWVARAALACRQGKYDDARKRLDEAQAKLGDRAEIRLERIRESLFQDHKVVEDELETLQQGWDQFPRDDQFALTRQMASARTALGDTAKAEVLWNQAIALRPEYLPGYLFLFDAAAGEKDQKRLTELLQKIERIEGREKGPLWCYGEAARRMMMSASDKSQLTAARNFLSEALVQRPRWARAVVMLAEVEKLDGNLAAATDQYETAVQLGDREPNVIHDLVLLLYRRQRFAEADQLLRNIEAQQGPFSADLERMASEVSWRMEDYGRALTLAKKSAESAKTVDDYLWLGQLLTVTHQPKEAEQAFRTAAQMAPTEPRAWQALVQHAVHQNSPEMIEQTLREAAEHLAPEKISLIRAQTSAALGKYEQAGEEYQKAIELKPDDSRVVGSAAEFFLVRQDFAKAEPLLRSLLDPKMECTADERAVARRQLAVLLAQSREYPKVLEALRLMDQNQKESVPQSDEDQRVRAMVTSALPGQESRTQAIHILEQLADAESPKPSDHFLLAQLYDANGQWPEARRHLQRLVGNTDLQPLYLAPYIRGLLDHKDFREAKLWLTRWEALHPDDNSTVEFRAELDVANGQMEQAVEAVTKQMEKSKSPSAKTWAANLLERLAAKQDQDVAKAKPLNDAAEKLLRELAQQDMRQTYALANFLARQERVSEAIDLCLAWVEKSPEYSKDALLSAVVAACQSSASTTDRLRVEQLVRQHLEKEEAPTQLLTALGTLYEAQTRYDEAINVYRHVLERDPNDIVALNNLALLLAHEGDYRQATDYLKQAMQIAGPRAELLDSQGTVQLAMGDAAAAIADYSAAIADKPSSTRWFHLAAAQYRAQHPADAEKAFDQALALGLKPEKIHPFEKDDYATLSTQFVH